MANSVKTNEKVNAVVASESTKVSNSFEKVCICLNDGGLGTNHKIYSIDDCIAVSCSVSIRNDWQVGEEKKCTLHVSKDGRFYVLDAIDGVSATKSKSGSKSNKDAIKAKIEVLRAKANKD